MINVTLATHPWLYAGIDDTAWNGDEIDGAGFNEFIFVDLVSVAHLTTPFIWNETLAFECYTFTVKHSHIEFCVKANAYNFTVRA